MDLGANQKSNQVETQPQPQIQPQPQTQTSPQQRLLPDPNRPSSTPLVPQPQGTVRTSAEIGTRPKTTVTPAAWRDPVGNDITIGNDTIITKIDESDEISLNEQGYARMQNMDISDISFHNILHEVNQPVPDEVASAPPYIMTAVEQNFTNEFQVMANDLANEMDNMVLDEDNPSARSQSPNPQDTNPFQLPVVQLYKANSEGHRAQFDILPKGV